MPTINLLKSNGVDEIRQLIKDASLTERRAAAQIIVSFPYDCFLETGAISLLTSWLLLQKLEGRRDPCRRRITDVELSRSNEFSTCSWIGRA